MADDGPRRPDAGAPVPDASRDPHPHLGPGPAAGEIAAAFALTQAQAGMDAWMAWAGQAGDAVVDLGSPTSVVDAGGDTGDPIGGYSIMQAESPDALATVLESHPHRAMGGTIQTLELLSMPGM